MQKIINKLFYLRLAHMTLMLAIGLCFYVFSKIPHSWWLMMTIYLMLGSVEPGLVKSRSIMRAKGTIMGLITFLPLIYLLQLNYRFIPYIFMLSVVIMNTISPKKYHYTTMFITLLVLMLSAYDFTAPTAEGPWQLTMNRSINTLLAITIIFAGEYFLFNRFRYASKLCYLYQIRTCRTINKIRILLIKSTRENQALLLDDISNLLSPVFLDLMNSSASILNLKTNITAQDKDRVQLFNNIAYQTRSKLLALYANKYVLSDIDAAIETNEIIKQQLATLNNTLVKI
jgi:hypothetical protein